MKDEIKEYIETLKEIVGDGGSKGDYCVSYDHWKQILDYITNLQEENERLTQGVTLLTNKVIDMTKVKEDYKTRNEKAIEEIKKRSTKEVADLYINLLQGKSDE